MTEKCHICKRDLNVPGDPTSEDCGGDCLSCMADACDPDCIESMKKIRRQELAACYGAGQIKQGLIAGEYPPPDVSVPLTFSGTVTGRITRRGWPFDYSMGPTKLADLQNVTTQQAEAATRVILGADFAELERRVMAWHEEICADLRAQGYRPAGDGPLSDTWIKDEEKPE